MSNYADLKVLVVDDYATMRRIIRSLLNKLEVTSIEEAEDGTAALNKLKSGGFDLVISDWNMEPMTGLDLLKQVRAAGGKLAEVPFIMVTAENTKENVVAAKNSGVDAYVMKPFNAETLQERIDAALAKRRG